MNFFSFVLFFLAFQLIFENAWFLELTCLSEFPKMGVSIYTVLMLRRNILWL